MNSTTIINKLCLTVLMFFILSLNTLEWLTLKFKYTVTPCLPWKSLLPGCVFSAYDMLMPKKQLGIGIVFSDLCLKAKKEQYNI